LETYLLASTELPVSTSAESRAEVTKLMKRGVRFRVLWLADSVTTGALYNALTNLSSLVPKHVSVPPVIHYCLPSLDSLGRATRASRHDSFEQEYKKLSARAWVGQKLHPAPFDEGDQPRRNAQAKIERYVSLISPIGVYALPEEERVVFARIALHHLSWKPRGEAIESFAFALPQHADDLYQAIRELIMHYETPSETRKR
jgi:hypothetical protein